MHMETFSDEELCRINREGNHRAEEILASRYQRLVRSIARPFFLAGGDREDLMQEGMLGLIKAIRQYDPSREASFYTFAGHCIRNEIYAVIKSASSGKHILLNQAVSLEDSNLEEATPSMQLDPEVMLIDAEKTENLLRMANRQLSVLEQKVLAYYLDGLTCREIADTVGRSAKSVDNAVQRIRRKIARQLESGDISNG